MKYTNETGLPKTLVSAIINDTYTPGEKADISCYNLDRPTQNSPVGETSQG